MGRHVVLAPVGSDQTFERGELLPPAPIEIALELFGPRQCRRCGDLFPVRLPSGATLCFACRCSANLNPFPPAYHYWMETYLYPAGYRSDDRPPARSTRSVISALWGLLGRLLRPHR